jgi:hypothetical protein
MHGFLRVEVCYHLCRIAANSLRSVTRKAHSLVSAAIEAENLVVRAGNQRFLGVVVGLVVLPDADALKADNRGFVVLRRRHIDAATLAVNRASEANFVALILGDCMSAVARWNRSRRRDAGILHQAGMNSRKSSRLPGLRPSPTASSSRPSAPDIRRSAS